MNERVERDVGKETEYRLEGVWSGEKGSEGRKGKGCFKEPIFVANSSRGDHHDDGDSNPADTPNKKISIKIVSRERCS